MLEARNDRRAIKQRFRQVLFVVVVVDGVVVGVLFVVAVGVVGGVLFAVAVVVAVGVVGGVLFRVAVGVVGGVAVGMNPNRKPFRADLIVFAVTMLLASWWIGFEMGRYQQPPMRCAEVLGLSPVSSTHDTCTYTMGTQGRAHWKMLAKQEGKK